GVLVLAKLQQRIAEHSVSVAVTWIEVDRTTRLGCRFLELVTRGKDVGEVARGGGACGRQVQRTAKRLLGQGEIAQVAGLARLLDVGIAQSRVAGRALRSTLDQALRDQDGLIRGHLLRRGRSPGRETDDGESD